MGIDGPVVLLVPIAPAATGNGLAMRAGVLLDTLALVAPVHVVVVPVSGPADDLSWATGRAETVSVVEPVTGASARDHMTEGLADEDLRSRLERTAPLPARATMAPPTLAAAVAKLLSAGLVPPAALVAMRLYLAPLGVHLARRLGAARVVIDADDDDVALLEALGDHAEADAFSRLARCWLPDADTVLAASSLDADGIARRAGISHVDVLPNAVKLPDDVPPAPRADRLLFVGNLTYAPNRDAARALAIEVLPAVQERRPAATLDLVGAHDGTLDELLGLSGVSVTGAVPDVSPYYASADVVVVPLRQGAGTRIKVLEAFAYHRPVVATPTAVSGLDLTGNEAVVAASNDALANAVVGILTDPDRAAAVVTSAAQLVRERYAHAAVAPIVHAATLGSSAPNLPPNRARRTQAVMSEERPTRVEGLEAHEVDDGLVVYQSSNDRVHYLNATAAVVFELCTGEHTEEEIGDLVGEAWRLPGPPREEVRACLAQLRAEGVLI